MSSAELPIGYAEHVSNAEITSPEQWRQQAKHLAYVLQIGLERAYLAAPPDKLFANTSALTPVGGGMPTCWLRVDCVGDASSKFHMDAIEAIQVVVASCHRPEMSRLFFLVRGDETGNHVYFGLRSLGYGVDSIALAASMKSLLESSWPGTRLSTCMPEQMVEADLATFMRRAGGRFAMTGVPTALRTDREGGFSLDCLLNGLMGRRFCYLIVADPISSPTQGQVISRARDLLGALHAVSKFSLTNSSSFSQTRGASLARGVAESFATQSGRSQIHKPHSDTQLLLENIAIGGTLLTPFVPFAGFVAGLALIGSVVLDQHDPINESHSVSHTTGTSTTTTESWGDTATSGTAIAREYVSSHLEGVMRRIEGLLQRLEGNTTWEVGAYLFSDSLDGSLDATAQLSALLNGPRKVGEEPVRFVDMQSIWRKGAEQGLTAGNRPQFRILNGQGRAALNHPLGAVFDGLSTPLNTAELALLMSLPRREVPGVNVRPYCDFGLNPQPAATPTLNVGRVLRGDDETPAVLSVSQLSLTKNVLVTGSVGSGKSNTVKHLLGQLRDSGTPFLVIEPAKSEYVEWARAINASLPQNSPERIQIFNPGGAPRGSPEASLRLNPFQVLSADNLTLHIERLKTLLIGSMPMQESLPMLLESVLYALYDHNGWFDERATAEQLPRLPTISQALLARRASGDSAERAILRERYLHGDTLVGDVVLSKGYEDRIAQSFIGALRTRLEFLCQKGSWKSEVFDCQNSTPAENLFGRPTVVNISNLHSDRPFAAGVLLSYLYEWRQMQNRLMPERTMGLGHLTVLEEAHCLLEATREVAADAMNPKGMLSSMCAEMLSEMRGWGQGFVIVDQYPTRLIGDAVKNTNLKIIHKLPARDDQDIVIAAMSLNANQGKLLPYLRPGQAIVSSDIEDFPFRVRIPIAGGVPK